MVESPSSALGSRTCSVNIITTIVGILLPILFIYQVSKKVNLYFVLAQYNDDSRVYQYRLAHHRAF